jgi:hypothetical protein
MQVIERIEGHYDIREVEFDAGHGWCPGCVLAECDCGEVVTLTESEAACVWCGADHTRVVREELDARELEDERARHRRYGRIEATCPESNARGILASASQAQVA